MSDEQPLGFGLIGCGAFGLFCLKAFAEKDLVRPVAAARARRPKARQVCEALGVRVYDDPQHLLADRQVDVVHVATPPAYHHQTVLSALAAGKHVLCEKPLALRSEQAEEMVEAARRAGRFLAVNFVMRYSPLVDVAKGILQCGAIGRPLAAHVTNCASDAGLDADHWFWDNGVSGGIFIEHGVHFFDLYDHWLGPGRVLDAWTQPREGNGQADRVGCTVRHDSRAIACHYHGFDQIAPMDRTSHRIVCELGDVRVEGWLPQRLAVDAAVNERTAEALSQCCLRGHIETVERYGRGRQRILGRGRLREATRRIRLHYALGADKETLYADCVRALLADQIAWVRDAGHPRRVTETRGVLAVRHAERAAALAAAAPGQAT